MNKEIWQGSRVVRITRTSSGYASRLWVNHGETATLCCAKAKTLKGAREQARRLLAL